MNILSFKRNEVVALVSKGLTREENIRHWDMCKALSEGKTIEQVAEDFRVSTSTVDKVKAKKCRICTTT